jgi:hypothetical protein
VSRLIAVFGSQKREGGRTSRKTISLKPQSVGLLTKSRCLFLVDGRVFPNAVGGIKSF